MRRLVTLVLLTLMLAACSSKPDEQAIREQVTARLLSGERTAIFEVRNFRKSNGFPRDENTYIAEVEYDLYFKVGLREAARALQPQSGSIFSAGVASAMLGLTYGDFKAGDIQHRKERVQFVRSEQGWQLVGNAEKGM